MKLAVKTSTPYPVSIFIAGDYDQAAEICQKYCDKVGLCVTVTPSKYVYTAGSEQGIIVGFINYPRFPSMPAEIKQKTINLGKKLLVDLNQQSFTVQGPDFCEWYSRRKEDLDGS